MKLLHILGRVLLVTIVSFAFISGFAHLDKAFAVCNVAADMVDCAACQTCPNYNIDGDFKVTTSDLLILLKCLRQPGGCTDCRI